MDIDTSRAGGSLVLRVWVEPGFDRALRARIMMDTGLDQSRTVYADSIGDVCAVIDEWITSVINRPEPPP